MGRGEETQKRNFKLSDRRHVHLKEPNAWGSNLLFLGHGHMQQSNLAREVRRQVGQWAGQGGGESFYVMLRCLDIIKSDRKYWK